MMPLVAEAKALIEGMSVSHKDARASLVSGRGTVPAALPAPPRQPHAKMQYFAQTDTADTPVVWRDSESRPTESMVLPRMFARSQVVHTSKDGTVKQPSTSSTAGKTAYSEVLGANGDIAAETLKLGAERMVYNNLLPDEARPDLMAVFSGSLVIPMHAERSNELSGSARGNCSRTFSSACPMR